MTTQGLKHGDRVIVSASMRRVTGAKVGYQRYEKSWQVFGTRDRHGIFLGWRTLANGVSEYGTFEEPTTFSAKEHIKVALVSVSTTRNPIYVPLDKMIVP